MKAVVHNQKYNSPLGLYSAENVAETLVTQAKVLTNGAAPVSVIYPKMTNVAGTKSSEVYRMVQNDEDEGKWGQRTGQRSPSEYPILQSQSFLKLQRSLDEDEELDKQYFSAAARTGYSASSPNARSPTNTNRRQPQAPPAPPPKPGQQVGGYVAAKPGPGNWTTAAQQPQVARTQQQQPQQQAARPQQQQQQQAPRPQQYQQPQQQAPQQQYHQQQQQHSPQSTSPYLSEQERYQLEQEKLQNRPKYQPQFMPAQQQQQQQQQRQSQQGGAPFGTTFNKSAAAKPGSTFQSIIPNENYPGSGSGAGGGFPPQQWSPTTGRKPVWPPPKSQEALLTSSQSIKWGGGSPAKKFIWPPPKDYVQVQEETDNSGYTRVVYREVPDAQRARSYVSPRAPNRLGADAWEPYSGNKSEDGLYNLSSGPGRRLRRFNDIFTPNSTRLPPTYRAPPGTQHVEFEYE